MKLILTPESRLLRQVEQLQKRLNHDKWRPNHNKEIEAMRRLADFIKERGDDVPDAFKNRMSIMVDPEAKIKQVVDSSTGANSMLTLLDLIRVWDEVSEFISSTATIFNHEETEIMLATARRQSFSAITYIPGDSPVRVIIFYDRLFAFIGEVAALLPTCINAGKTEIEFAHLFPDVAIQRIEKDIVNDKILNIYFESIYERYFLKKIKQPVLWADHLSEDSRIAAMDIEDSIRYFVISHEIAHILFNHPKEKKQQPGPREQNFSNDQLHEIRITSHEEFEADYIGFDIGLLCAIGNHVSEQLYVWGVMLFFMVVNLIDEHEARFGKRRKQAGKHSEKKDGRSTHPSAGDRLKLIVQAIAGHAESMDKIYDIDVPQIIESRFRAWLQEKYNSGI